MTDYPVPSLKESIEAIEKSYDAKLTLEECPVDERKAEARVLGYAVNSLHGHIQYQGKQIFADSSNHENLLKHGAEIGLFPKTKTNSVGSVSVNAVVGSVIPAGTVLFRPLDNRQYAVTEDTTVEASPQVVNVRALEAGAAGNAEAGEILNFSVVLSGVDNKATVILIGSGADDETDKDFALRIHQTLQSIYHGGNDNDYVKWALQVEGVNQAWAYPCEQGVGSTVVRIMTPNGFPDGILLQKVADYIDTKRPPTYNNFFVVSPIERPIDLTISGLLPDTPEMRAAVQSAVKNSFNTNCKPGGEVTTAQLNSAILSVLGLKDYHLDAPTANIQLGTGEIAVLGEITWI